MRSSSRVRRTILGAIALLVGLVPAIGSGRQSEPPITIENVVVGLAEDRDSQVFKVGTWTPVRVDLRAGAEPFEGVLRLEVPDDGGVPTFVQSRVNIPAGETRPVVLYARPGDSTVSFRAEVLDARGRRRDGASNDSALWLEPDQLVLAAIGNPGGLDLLPGMPEFQTADASRTSRLHVTPLRIPEGIPDRWFGYDAVEALVLDLNAQGALEALQDFRSEPLKQWIRNGGHLVIAGGFPRWEQASSSDAVLRELLPALPVGRTETGDLGAIESYVGSNSPITTPERPVSITTFEPIPDRGARILLDDRSVGGPVIVRGPYGFGRVTMVGLSVDESPFVDWPDRRAFWAAALDLGGRETAPLDPTTSGAFAYYDVIDLSSYLHRALEQFQGVRLIPFGWVAGFVFLYILLIGPGDYFFLKRVLKRMELTWITFPTIVVVVSVAAYATAYAVKGTDLRINRVDVVDIDQGFGDGERFLSRGTSFATLFSPQNRDYDITVRPLPVEVADPEAAGVIPSEEVDEVITTWFGIAEQRFGGMGNSGGVALTSSGYTYRSPNDPSSSVPPSELVGVRVPIWTTKALMGSWTDDAPAAVKAELSDPGANRLEGTVMNLLDRPLRSVRIAYGGDIYQIDRPIAPGETVSLNSASNRNLSGFLEDTGRSLNRINAAVPGDAIPRADLVRALSFARAGRRRGQKPNLVLGDLDLSAQLDLGRPILIAELDGPSSALLLDGSRPAAAREDQGTILRVLLPAPSEE
jgi:hypothetical protein